MIWDSLLLFSIFYFFAKEKKRLRNLNTLQDEWDFCNYPTLLQNFTRSCIRSNLFINILITLHFHTPVSGLDTNFFCRWYAGPLDPNFRWSFLNTGGPSFFYSFVFKETSDLEELHLKLVTETYLLLDL
jgi:hypothetical protein